MTFCRRGMKKVLEECEKERTECQKKGELSFMRRKRLEWTRSSSRAIFFWDQLVRYINDLGRTDYPVRLPNLLRSGAFYIESTFPRKLIASTKLQRRKNDFKSVFRMKGSKENDQKYQGEREIRFISLPQRGMNKEEQMKKNISDWF